MKENYRLLSRYIRRNDFDEVLKILRKDQNLDVMHDDGTLFWVSIEDHNIKITEALLEYFEENQLNKYSKGSNEYHELKKQMQHILEIAIEDVELAKEMQELLSKYIDFTDEEEERENAIKEIDDLVSHYEKEMSHSSKDNNDEDYNTPIIGDGNDTIVNHIH